MNSSKNLTFIPNTDFKCISHSVPPINFEKLPPEFPKFPIINSVGYHIVRIEMEKRQKIVAS